MRESTARALHPLRRPHFGPSRFYAGNVQAQGSTSAMNVARPLRLRHGGPDDPPSRPTEPATAALRAGQPHMTQAEAVPPLVGRWRRPSRAGGYGYAYSGADRRTFSISTRHIQNLEAKGLLNEGQRDEAIPVAVWVISRVHARGGARGDHGGGCARRASKQPRGSRGIRRPIERELAAGGIDGW